MKIFIDDNEYVDTLAKNGVTVIIRVGDRDRHVRVTHEGVVIDLIRNDEVEGTCHHSFAELDPKDGYCAMCGSYHDEVLVCQVADLERQNKTHRLDELFSELSEFYWSAGWLVDLDLRLWVWLQNPNSPLRPEHREELARLSRETGKWFWWPNEDGERAEPIDLEKWKKQRADDIEGFRRREEETEKDRV